MDELRMTKTSRLDASGLITDRACYIFTVCGIGVSASTNVFDLYDGFNTSDRKIITLGGIQYQADFRVFTTPLYFAKGAYIDFATNGTEFFIQYAEVDE